MDPDTSRQELGQEQLTDSQPRIHPGDIGCDSSRDQRRANGGPDRLERVTL